MSKTAFGLLAVEVSPGVPRGALKEPILMLGLLAIRASEPTFGTVTGEVRIGRGEVREPLIFGEAGVLRSMLAEPLTHSCLLALGASPTAFGLPLIQVSAGVMRGILAEPNTPN
jgi:hypothetical protein